MLAGTTGISVPDTFNISLLQRIQEELTGLPRKQKTQYALLEAESFLHRWINSALKKNYSVAEIDGLLLNAGMSDLQVEGLWKFYERRENRRKHKRMSPIKMSRKTKKAISHEDTPMSNSATQFVPKNAVENSSEVGEPTVQSIAETPQHLSGGHFDLPPDTEDI